MNFLLNLDLLTVGVVIAATGILGFIAFFNNPKSITSKTFLIFCLLTITWGTLNYLSYQVHDPKLAILLLRISIACAVWHSFFLFQLLYIFPEESFIFSRSYKYGLRSLVLLASLLNLTPFTFSKVAEVSSTGQVVKVVNGPGIALFTFLILGLIIGGIVVFIKKIKNGKKINSKQGRPVLIGIIITFALILIFNFIFPAFLNNSRYITMGALFIFPFVVGTGYSIFKHKFLELKVVSTEILTFILAIIILLEVITSTDFFTVIFRISIFLLVVALGILLIKSVIREIQQREQLEILSKELEDANEKLKALDLARAEFISIASHQLRTPPATIKWYMSSILSGDYGKIPKEAFTQLEKVQTTNNGLISLIEDILNVSRIERGKMEFMFQEIELSEIATQAYEQLIPIAKEKGLKYTFKKPKKTLPKIMADREKLKQVMNNIIDNSIKYTPKGSVEVSLSATLTDIVFEVKDTGKGFSKEEESQIFQKFSRGKESLKHSAGLGLGLYVAKIIIEQHKGKLLAQSTGEGKGSKFSFTIPIHSGIKTTTLVDLGK